MGWQDDPQVKPAAAGKAAWESDSQVGADQNLGLLGHVLAGEEAALHVGSQMAAFPVEAAASAYQLAFAKPGEKVNKAREAIGGVSEAMTYQPRTEEGKKVAGAADTGLGLPGKYADIAGEKVTQATGSAGLGAATSLGLQALPAVLGARGLRGKVVTPGMARTAAAGTAQAAERAAEAYVNTRTALDWGSLPANVKNMLASVARDAKSLDKLDPKAVERVARASKVGAPITRGQATRSLSQLTDEEMLQKSDAGRPLQRIQTEQDIALHGKLSEVRGATGGQAETRQQLGRSVQGAARAKLKALKRDYEAKYTKAREGGETAQPADIKPLEDFMQVPAHKRNLGFLDSAIKEYQQKAATEDVTMAGEGIKRTTGEKGTGQVTINDLEEIRKEVVAASRSSDGPTRHFAGEALKVIDGVLEQSGGDLYKTARAAFKATKQEFDQQTLVKKLTSEKARSSDRTVALEDTFDTVVRSGSAEQLKGLVDSLTKGGTAKTRRVGTQAVKDLQAATVDYLREKAGGKRGIKGEEDQMQFNSSFIEAFDELDKDGKIDVLMGPKARATLQDIRAAAHDLRTKPASRIAGSDTVPRLVRAIEKLSKIPLIGTPLEGAAKLAGKVTQLGREGRQVREATTNPLAEATKIGEKQRRKANTVGMLQTAAPFTPATVRDAAQ